MIEIWQEYACFQTSQRLADQVKVIKKGWFSDLEVHQLNQKTNKEQDTISEKPSFVKQKQSNQNEPPTL